MSSKWRVHAVAYLPQPRPVRGNMLLLNVAKHPVDYNVSVHCGENLIHLTAYTIVSVRKENEYYVPMKHVTESLSVGELV
jgi:hypothetical protein